MKDNADDASRDRAASDASVVEEAASPSWDPHEVWLTRIKQPRERAARSAAALAASRTHERSD